MPALIAFPTGVVNELELISVVAMPAAFAEIAAVICGHLRGDRVRRTGPLRRGQAEECGGVGEAVLGRREEGVRGDVVDEPELPGRRLREVPRRVLGGGAPGALRRAARRRG